ncbi:MAG: malectin domain-containing carbohydrate-binding protein, partial [Rhodothermales bacterium]|nr:malectin domain-containing carbohydrate-binding protein [Rhodothermales bacterium]
GDTDPFPGTIWAADFASYDIWVFEPGDYGGAAGGVCTGVSDPLLDEDGDGFDNEDETLNASNPCSAASKPADNDGDLTSNLLDADDDNDGVNDLNDSFATDATNGTGLTLPVNYPLLNEDPGTGFYGVGFTGLMTNGVTNYLDQYEENNLVPGGTAGLFTVSAVSEGDATGATNTQENGFQFGVNVAGVSGPYTVKVRITGPFFDGVTPQDNQALGMYIGPGNMDNYVKVALNAQAGAGGLQVIHEAGGVATVTNYIAATAADAINIDLLLTVNPVAGTIQPKYIQDNQPAVYLGLPLQVSGSLLQAIQGTYQVAPGVPSGLAVGIISTSAGAGPVFAATWDAIDVAQDPNPIADLWHTYQAPTDPRQRHENTFVKHDNNFYLIGGRGSRRTDRFVPATGAWTQLSLPPIQMHHFQAVSLGNVVYVAGAYVGDFPSETPVPNIYTYAPNTDTWTVGATIPAARLRGSAGAVAYNGKLYLVSGSLGGHAGSAVYLPMFDQYDPATGAWTIMPNMPRGRDHFNAAIIGDKLYVAGGRAGSVGSTIPEVDVYDFNAGSWSTLPVLTGNIPTPRGGTAAAVVGNDLFILGGESGLQQLAHNEVEVLDTSTNSWRTLDALNTGRHGTAAVVDGTRVYIAAGSGETGGGPEMSTMEVFDRTALSDPGSVVPSTLAADPTTLAFGLVQTGLDDAEMIALYNTGGNQDISISSLSLTGSPAFSLSYAFSLPAVIPPGDTLYADVTFAPTTLGAVNATLTVNHNGSNGSIAIPVSGEGVNGGGGVVTGDPIFRVNAGGGNLVDALKDWDRDTKNIPSPHVNASGNDNRTGKITTFTGVNGTDAPNDVFLTNRWDPTGGVEMIWNFAAPQVGLYQVNLYFLESDASNHTVGGRVFDIKMENAMVFEDFDIFAEAGANTTIKKSAVVNVADGSVTIELAHVIDNPIVHALEIRPVLGADLFASPATVDFFSVPVDVASAPKQVYYSNTSTGARTVTGVSITGANAAEFSHDFVGSVNLASGAMDSLEVVLTPTTEGVRTASLEIAHTGAGSPAVVTLTGDGTNVHLSFVEVTIVGSGTVTKTPDKPLYSDGEVVTLTAIPDPGWQFSAWSGDIVSPDNPFNYSVFTDASITATFIESATTIDPLFRVNAGNGSISDTPIVWERDTKNKPAPFSNAATGGDNSISKAAFVGSNTTDAPSEIFSSNRWDPVGGTLMEWNFPVGLAGDYEVNLYFAETGTATNDIGERLFDVVIENNLVLNDYDVVADAGYQTAVKKSFIVTVSDGNIDINFFRVVDNPFVSGIEIVPTPATVPLNARYNGVDNTFIVRRYQQVLDGSWSLVGLPLVSEANAGQTFATDELLQYADGKYAPTTAMIGGRGYWARAEEEQLTTLQGERLDTMTVALKAGWNMIAGASCDLDLNLMAGAEHIVPNSLYRYDTDSGYQPADRLQQGRGYWVRAKEAGALRFDCSNTSSFRLPNDPTDLGSFGRVAISDDEGRLQTLHFGGEIEDALLTQYSMPPLAPDVAFDIRYADQSRLSKTTANVVQLKHVAFPLTLRMEALPEGGNDNEYVVSRMRNGAEVETFRVRTGGTLAIEDAETDALMIQSLSEWQSELPEAFGLKGNYPNPFNPVTQIVFDLPEAADVSIEVFDLLGRRVRQINAIKLAAGQSRQIEMDGRGLASGVYLYRVEAVMPAQTVSDTGKMILLK